MMQPENYSKGAKMAAVASACVWKDELQKCSDSFKTDLMPCRGEMTTS